MGLHIFFFFVRRERFFLQDSLVSVGCQMVGKAVLCLDLDSDLAIHTIKHSSEYLACALNSRMFLVFPSQRWLSSLLVHKEH